MEKRKSGLQWWFNLSISRKTLLMQSVIIFLPLAILVYFLLSVSYMDYASHAAKTSYEYARFTLDSLEAEMMQIKSACNVLLSHSQVQNLLTHPEAVEDPAEMEKMDFWISSTTGLRRRVFSTTLYATEHACAAAQEAFPIWTEPAAGTGWRFTPQKGSFSSSMSWVQEIYVGDTLMGVLCLELQPDLLSETLNKLSRVIGGYCIAYREDTEQVVGGRLEDIRVSDDVFEMCKDMPEGYQLINHHEYVGLIHCSTMNISFLTFCNTALSANFVSSYLMDFSIIAGILLLMCALAVALNHYSITRRIKNLSGHISRQASSLQSLSTLSSLTRLQVDGTDEIGTLASNYNIMLEHLLLSAQREHQAELLQQTARFSALQAQIQPHFLYNTLESLRMMADESEAVEVSEMLFVLGKLMRGSISGKEQEITMARELENCVYYLKLSKLRFEALEYSVTCDIDASSLVCPRFILQPLVENSIHHGISRTRSAGIVRVHVYRQGDLVFIDVEDNGKGISPDRLEEIRDAMENGNGLKQEQGGIGLCNVHHRLHIYFGGRSGLSLYSTSGAGTLCRITIDLSDGSRNHVPSCSAGEAIHKEREGRKL